MTDELSDVPKTVFMRECLQTPVKGDFAISGVVIALTFDCQLLARKPVATLEHLTVATLSNYASGILSNTLEAIV